MQIIYRSALTDQGRVSLSLAQSRLGDNSGRSNMPTSGCHADGSDAAPPWLVGRNSERSHPLTRCEGSGLHLPAGEMAGERKRGGGWRTEQIEMRGIHFHFDCEPGVFLSFLFFLFFFLPLSITLTPGLWAEWCHDSVLWSIYHHFIDWDKWPFLYVEHEETWNCMPAMQTYCHYTNIHPHTPALSLDVWYQAKRLCSTYTRALLCLQCWWLSFSVLFSHSYCLWTSSFFSITCSFWFRENHQAYTIESFFFHSLPSHPPHVSLHSALFSIKIGPLDKRGTNAFTDRGGDWIVWNR